jgi:hypothetical protein
LFHQRPPAALVHLPADQLHPIPAGEQNAGCHVEQKNWDIARRTVGYWRYDTPSEAALLNQIWAALSPLINPPTPQQKLMTKTRVGAKVTRTYDTRQTRYQRLLGHPEALDDLDARRLATQLSRRASRSLACRWLRSEKRDHQGYRLRRLGRRCW